MKSPHRVGDRVQLRSGGPWMTVAGVRKDGVIDVQWFVGGALSWNAFMGEQLRVHWFDALVHFLKRDHPYPLLALA